MRTKLTLLLIAAMLLFGWLIGMEKENSPATEMKKSPGMETGEKSSVSDQKQAIAVFAGGCFWCTESDFEKVPGVFEAISGYTGGHVENPTYEQSYTGTTGHAEAVKVFYDPDKVSYAQLVEWFWRHVDATDADGQFHDRGSQYRSAIFYANEEQRQLAEESKRRLGASGRFGKPIVTEITPLGPFYEAEDYHQDYHANPSLFIQMKYSSYRLASGRDQFLEKIWGDEHNKLPTREEIMSQEKMFQEKMGKETSTAMEAQRQYEIPSDEELRSKLTPMQYEVTQEEATETPFENRYWNNHADGIYVDIVSGEPLFSSKDKYESHSGWPSFTRPLVSENVVEKTDWKLIYPRTEIRSKHADSHLGHVFNDGPPPTGLRYCMNSAALRFIPADHLEAEGYGEFTQLFEH